MRGVWSLALKEGSARLFAREQVKSEKLSPARYLASPCPRHPMNSSPSIRAKSPPSRPHWNQTWRASDTASRETREPLVLPATPASPRHPRTLILTLPWRPTRAPQERPCPSRTSFPRCPMPRAHRPLNRQVAQALPARQQSRIQLSPTLSEGREPPRAPRAAPPLRTPLHRAPRARRVPKRISPPSGTRPRNPLDYRISRASHCQASGLLQRPSPRRSPRPRPTSSPRTRARQPHSRHPWALARLLVWRGQRPQLPWLQEGSAQSEEGLSQRHRPYRALPSGRRHHLLRVQERRPPRSSRPLLRVVLWLMWDGFRRRTD
ncbi:Uncharacterised protein [Mycobacteroides abscessus subsp. massiliense]|nr:Uncharacterised protein [Mycobacteroides abscessus subsp. massiliense]